MATSRVRRDLSAGERTVLLQSVSVSFLAGHKLRGMPPSVSESLLCAKSFFVSTHLGDSVVFFVFDLSIPHVTTIYSGTGNRWRG